MCSHFRIPVCLARLYRCARALHFPILAPPRTQTRTSIYQVQGQSIRTARAVVKISPDLNRVITEVPQ
jgi:hypothetical protein